jgi:hypothetical protein
MKKFLPFLGAAFLLSAIMPARANLIVYGVINGVVTFSSPGLKTIIGMPVSGTFSYDYNLLSAPDSSGDRTVDFSDPNASFVLASSAGDGGAYYTTLGRGFGGLIVNANGLPYSGTGAGNWDAFIGPSSVTFTYFAGPNVGFTANVTYAVTGVPDAGATWLLLGIGLVSVMITQHVHVRHLARRGQNGGKHAALQIASRLSRDSHHREASGVRWLQHRFSAVASRVAQTVCCSVESIGSMVE